MDLKVIAMYDSKINAYLKPMMFRTHGEALRAVLNAMETKDTDFSKHPEDFALFEIAEYDEVKGDYKNHAVKICVARLWELAPQRPKVVKTDDALEGQLPLIKEAN